MNLSQLYNFENNGKSNINFPWLVLLFPLLDDGFPGDDVTFFSDMNVSPGFQLSYLLSEILATVSASFDCVVPSAHIQRKKCLSEWFMSQTSNVLVAFPAGSTIKMSCYQGKLLHDLTLNKEKRSKHMNT